MPYTAYPKAPSQALETTYKTAQTKLDANKNPLKSGDLKKALDTAGKALAAKLETDIAAIRANAIQHFQKVDAWLANAVTTLKRGKDAQAAYAQTGQKTDADTAMAALARIQGLHQEAHADAQSFGASWFEYRGYNPEADKKYIAKFKDEVGKIMVESKGFLAKIARIDSLAQEAAALKNLTAAKRDDHGIVDKQHAAATMFATLEDMLRKMFSESRDAQNAMGNMDTIKTNANDPKQAKIIPLKNLEQIFGNLTNLIRIYQQSIISMQNVFDTTTKQFQGDDLKDPEIKTAIAKSTKLLTETRYKVQALESGYKTTLKDMEKLRGNYKKK